jgi:hypothetical protein
LPWPRPEEAELRHIAHCRCPPGPGCAVRPLPTPPLPVNGSRDEVASVIARLQADRRSSRRVLSVSSGELSIDAALDEVLDRPAERQAAAGAPRTQVPAVRCFGHPPAPWVWFAT